MEATASVSQSDHGVDDIEQLAGWMTPRTLSSMVYARALNEKRERM